jgi:hypothetical protein
MCHALPAVHTLQLNVLVEQFLTDTKKVECECICILISIAQSSKRELWKQRPYLLNL